MPAAVNSYNSPVSLHTGTQAACQKREKKNRWEKRDDFPFSNPDLCIRLGNPTDPRYR